MTKDQFVASLAADAPPAGLSAPLQALWRSAKDDWDAAHKLVQSDDSKEAAWVHAHLHRIEGDIDNAGYWYRRADRPAAESDLADERASILATLLP